MDTPFVSVIIPVFNDAVGLFKALKALAEQSYPQDRFEVVVVDNGSTQDMAAVCAKHANVRYEFENIASSYRARNRGVAVSRGSVLAFTDADCLPDPGWIENGVQHLIQDSSLGLLGGPVEVFPKHPTDPNAVEVYEMITAFPIELFIRRWSFTVTANLFVRRAVFEEVGGFHSSLKSAGDLEWGQRATRAGHTLGFCQRAEIRHPARSTLGALLQKTRRIQGGLHDLRQLRGNLPLWPYLGSSLATWPSPLDCLRGLQRLGISSPGMKLKVLAIMVAYKSTRLLESLRLLSGASSRRA